MVQLPSDLFIAIDPVERSMERQPIAIGHISNVNDINSHIAGSEHISSCITTRRITVWSVCSPVVETPSINVIDVRIDDHTIRSISVANKECPHNYHWSGRPIIPHSIVTVKLSLPTMIYLEMYRILSHKQRYEVAPTIFNNKGSFRREQSHLLKLASKLPVPATDRRRQHGFRARNRCYLAGMTIEGSILFCSTFETHSSSGTTSIMIGFTRASGSPPNYGRMACSSELNEPLKLMPIYSATLGSSNWLSRDTTLAVGGTSSTRKMLLLIPLGIALTGYGVFSILQLTVGVYICFRSGWMGSPLARLTTRRSRRSGPD